VDSITVFKPDGSEESVWRGRDPTAADETMGVATIPFAINFETNRLRIHLDARRVPGWNAIDAVGLVTASGDTHWACAASASSTRADAPPPERH